jgi:large subunit ribosomal protein L13e
MKSDSSKEEISAFMSSDATGIRRLKTGLPVEDMARQEAVGETKKSEIGEGTKDAYRVLRDARSDARLVGVREKRAKAKADEANAAKK